MLKAILFDLDDTLLDWSGFSGDWKTLECQFLKGVFDYVATVTNPLPDLDAFIDEFHQRIREAWRIGRGNLIAPNMATILLESVEAQGAQVGTFKADELVKAYAWHAVPGTALFKEVPEVMALIKQHGIKTAIVTNAAQPMTLRDIEIEEHKLLQYFPDCRLSAADAGVLKPHPGIFQLALERLGVTPEEAVFVGDNPIADIAGAQSVGMQAVFRITSPMPPMLSGLIVPDAAINSLEELPPILDSWFPGWREN
jgi:putative hydrolase of the HAD superfamily